MINERLESALIWCREHKLGLDQLKKFNRESKKKRFKEKKSRSLSKKEYKEMCKKAGIKKESLCKTVFTKNL